MRTAALDELGELVGPAGLLTTASDLARYEHAPNGLSGRAAFAVRPADTAQVAAVLDWAHRHRIRLVPQGANSGLVAAALPDDTGVLSTERLRGTFDIDVAGRTLVVSAGWNLDEINERLAADGLHLPVEVGSSPSAGGMVSTNTAGSHLIKYGDVRSRVLGLRAAVPDGARTVLDLLRPLRKRNEGLDLKQVFIGTAGAYGVVTEAAFELAPLPASRAAAWLAVPEHHLLDVLTDLESRCGPALSAYEVVSPAAVRLLANHFSQLTHRVPDSDGFLVLVEIAAADDQAGDLLTAGLEEATDRGWLTDARVGPAHHMWEVRHAIPEITERMDPVLSLDLAAPRSRIAACRADVVAQLALSYAHIEPIELGHYGDGGIHMILPLPESVAADRDAVNALRMFVYDIVVHRHGGTFSAEHGIGPKNYDAYLRYVPEQVRMVAGLLKSHLDPRDVLGSVSLR
ncbi:FAD-binding oxidoreductase [Streptomyces sp. NPDC057543]|uniref:FAD-binding oxidoreductase n=1 Tax=Streptomyces sp. NPDC057543 TaxID=3346163 RepID=UPI0036903354